jgi:hypothetical protein
MNTTHHAVWSHDSFGRRVPSKKGCAGWIDGLCASLLVLAGCGGGGSSSTFSLAKFCTDFDNATTAVDAQFNRLDPPSQAELVAVAATIRQIAGEAPAAVEGDLTVEADAFQKASTNGNLDDAAASAADDRVVAYVDSNCAAGTDAAAAAETSAAPATTPAVTEAPEALTPVTNVQTSATLPARTTVAPTTTRPAPTTTAAAATTTTPPATPGCTTPTKAAFSGDLVGHWAFMIGSPDNNPDAASLIPRCSLDDGVTITAAADGTFQVTSNSPASFITFGRTECPDLPAGTVVMTFTGAGSPYAGEYPTYDDKTCALVGNSKVPVAQGTLDDGTPTLDFGQPGGYFVELIWLG